MKRNRKGSALLEAALVFPLFAGILAGAVELSSRLMAGNFASWAAREAVRFAEVRGASANVPATAESIESHVRGLAVGVPPSEVRAETEWLPDNQPGSRVRIRVFVGQQSAQSEIRILR